MKTKSKKAKRTNPILYVLLIVFISSAIGSGSYLFKYYYDIYITNKLYGDLRKDIGDDEDNNKPVIRRDGLDITREDDPNEHKIRHSK